jgi:fatty acid desaturase
MNSPVSVATNDETFVEPHEPHWLSRAAFPVIDAILFVVLAGIGYALYHNNYWVAVPLSFAASHLMHGLLIGFHEASHGLLRKHRTINDLDGVLLGMFSFMSFTLYRASHQTHHMHLATPRDEELWPFVVPGTPRWVRVLAACLELTCGVLFTPFLFLRTFLRENSPIRAPKVRIQIWKELLLIAVAWAAIVTTVATFDLWKYFVWMYAVPAVLAGNMQSLRKYIEHVGMTGCTPNSATRSIVSDTVVGRLTTFTLLHEPYHGVHHEMAGITHAELPLHADVLEPKEAGDVPPFASYGHAFLHLLKSLADPKVGPQWKDTKTC